jgi:NTE family protein
MGFSRGDRFLQILRLVTKNKTFADLDVKFCAVAVDVQHGEEVLLTEGPVAEAVLASTFG